MREYTDGWYLATTRFLGAGARVERGVIVEAAPILRWAVGRRVAVLDAYCRRHGGDLTVAHAASRAAGGAP